MNVGEKSILQEQQDTRESQSKCESAYAARQKKPHRGSGPGPHRARMVEKEGGKPERGFYGGNQQAGMSQSKSGVCL